MNKKEALKDIERQINSWKKGEDFEYSLQPLIISAKALRKTIAKKVIVSSYTSHIKPIKTAKCPDCGRYLNIYEEQDYCKKCGQRLDIEHPKKVQVVELPKFDYSTIKKLAEGPGPDSKFEYSTQRLYDILQSRFCPVEFENEVQLIQTVYYLLDCGIGFKNSLQKETTELNDKKVIVVPDTEVHEKS